MFNIFKSNKMENLMEALTSVLKQVPDNPMMPEWIGIQSRGMKQWISILLSQSLGVCANIDFLFPRQMIDQIITNFKPLEDHRDSHESLNEDLLFWSVMKYIHDNPFQKGFSIVENYIRGDETGKKQYQLSMKIAKVFDDYQVYRPTMLVDWQKRNFHESLKDPVTQWQADLWTKFVSKDPQNHLAFKVSIFLEKFSRKNMNKDNLPPRVSLFGISALPELFLQVFEKMSEIMDINLFLLTPSSQFFFDIKSAKQIEKIAIKQESGIDPEKLYYEMTNPLLSSMGTAGKKFHSFLETFNYNEPFDDLFQDPIEESGRSNTMLAYLQSDILNLVLRKKKSSDAPVTIDASDTSVCIHACHSPMREAQVLKDLLLNEFEKDPELNPHDIIVMMPDIEVYAPFIEAAFSLETSLPFSISDRKKRSESESLDAFLKILALRNARFEKTEVLDLLLSPSIAQKFNIAVDEILMIEKMVDDSNILWGKDGNHRQTLGLPAFEENTWQFGLQRLFMGMAMPENYETLVQNILQCQSFEGLELEVLGKFVEFCNTFFSCLETLTGQKTIEKWCEALKNISSLLMDWNFKNSEDMIFLSQIIDELKADAQKAEFSEYVSFDVVNSYVEHKLDQTISQGSFLAGNITFCNIMPMRSIPFKIVVLMGMDEASFPRQAFTTGFDMIKKYPMSGDKIERDEDRYLFLETLLSARLKFIVTYTGMSIQDNSKIPCSGVVSELFDTMDQSFIFQKGFEYHFFHLLHPFNEAYFNQSGRFFSFSKDNLSIAKALCPIEPEKDRLEKFLFFKDLSQEQSKEALLNITLDEIIYFFKNPVQGFMKQGLNIKMPDLEDNTCDREIFSISGLDQYTLGSLLVEKKSSSFEKKDFYPIAKAMGSLPFGLKGKFEYEKIINLAEPIITAARDIAAKKQLSPVGFDVNIDDVIISGSFSDIRQDGVYGLTYGKLNGARLLSGWIRHLFLNIHAPSDYPGQTILIGRDPKGKKPIVSFSFPALKSGAQEYFKALVQMYTQGMLQPLCFFSETSLQFVQALLKENLEPDPLSLDRDQVFKAMNKARTFWYGGYYQPGEKENSYISLYVENNDPFESVDALLLSGFARNALAIYKPLLDNLKIIS